MKTTTFGPGSLESIELRHRTRNVGFTRPQVRAVGTFTVYCGMGNDHSVSIDSGWVDTSDVTAAVDYNVNDDSLADVLIEWELEDWFDPCDTGPDVDYFDGALAGIGSARHETER